MKVENPDTEDGFGCVTCVSGLREVQHQQLDFDLGPQPATSTEFRAALLKLNFEHPFEAVAAFELVKEPHSAEYLKKLTSEIDAIQSGFKHNGPFSNEVSNGMTKRLLYLKNQLYKSRLAKKLSELKAKFPAESDVFLLICKEATNGNT